jgi:hypothetical protein
MYSFPVLTHCPDIIRLVVVGRWWIAIVFFIGRILLLILGAGWAVVFGNLRIFLNAWSWRVFLAI